MEKSLLQKGLLYKEWVQKRRVAVLAFLLMIPAVFLQITAPLNSVGSLTDFCNQISGQFVIGWGTTFIVVGLAVFSLWSERNHELWWFTLSGPVTKRQVLRAKYTIDLSVIVAVFTLFAIVLTLIDASFGFSYPWFGIVRWWVAELAIQCSMYALALLMATLIGNTIAAVLLTFGIANIPMYAGVPMVIALGANLVVFADPAQYYIPFSWKLMWVFTHLSPLNWYGINLATVWMSPWPFFLWFLLFTLLACTVAERIYERTNNERFARVFAFQWMRHPFTLMMSAITAYVVVKIAEGHSYWPYKPEWLVAITMVLWAAATLVSRRGSIHKG